MTRRSPETLLPLTPATFHVLVSIADEPRHGYAIIKHVSAATGGRVELGAGTLYQILKRALASGLIAEAARARAGDDEDRRRCYRITPFGRDVVSAEAARLAQMVDVARASGVLGRSRS